MPVPDTDLPVWHYAHGEPSVHGLIKQAPSDFQVTERLGFDLTSDGEHDFLWIEKESSNTLWVARALAEHANIPLRDVGYSGLKDRHAVTRQWFSVRRPSGIGTDWTTFAVPKIRILKAARHQKKLKRGVHTANHFRIAIRGGDFEFEEIVGKLKLIQARGVPNYFGEQRFGRRLGNIDLAKRMFAGARLPREKRSLALSAARSWIFNELLSERVLADNWDKQISGDIMNLDGTNSVFVPDQFDDELRNRVASMDIHPTGVLWGEGGLIVTGDAGKLEHEIAMHYEGLARGLVNARLKKARRPFRIAVQDLTWEIGDTVIWLTFNLGKGSFATSVLREIVADS